MSRRTAQASKAIRLAWQRERELVALGQGTRDWTEEQQRSILEGRCPHDENGRAFEGHHMMSAEAHPELQGEPGNIQFLTRSEHLDAHGGSWGRPTCGRYDPEMHTTSSFPCDSYVPCETFALSEPVATTTETRPSEPESSKVPPSEPADSQTSERAKAHQEGTPHRAGALLHIARNAIRDLTAIGRNVTSFARENPIETIGLALGAVAAVAELVSSASDGKPADGPSYDESDLDIPGEAPESFDGEDATGAPQHTYPNERQSPCAHMVQGYDRTQNGKTIHVDAYSRGGKNQKPEC